MRTLLCVLLVACLSGVGVSAQTPAPIPTIQILTPEQLAIAVAQMLDAQKELRGQIERLDDHLTQHDQQPMWITQFMKSPFGIILTSVASTCVASQCWKHLGGK